MKTIKIIVALIITISSCSLCYSQAINTPTQWLAFQQRELKNCPYIFEGKIIQQSNSGTSATCSVLQITKIYRGTTQLKLGNIKVITTILRGAEKFPQLANGSTYIIFGNLSNSTTFQSINTDNSLTLWCNDWVVLYDTAATWGWRQVSRYKTLDSLYSFFKENGVTVEEEAPTDNTLKK